MPERWDRELRRLRSLEPREQIVRERVERGPSGSGRPGGRERVIAGTVAAVVFIAAAAFSREAFLMTSPERDHSVGEVGSLDLPPLTISAHAEPGQSRPPEAMARYGGVEAAIPVQGGEGWGMGNAFPGAMFGPHEAAIPVDAPLLIESNADQLEVGFSRTYPEGDLIPQSIDPGTVMTLPSEPGQLLIQLSATWPDGRAEFSIFFDLYAPVEVLEADCRAHRAPVWQSRVVRAHPDGIHATFQADVARDLRIEAPGFTSGVLATLKPGLTSLELPIPPGVATVGCNNAPDSQITVVDPGGLWAPAQLGCPRGDKTVSVAAEEVNDRMIDETAILERLLVLDASDEVVPPGYPEAGREAMLPSKVVVRRDGEIVAKLDVWLGRPARIDGTACSSASIRAKDDVTPAMPPSLSAAPALRVHCGEQGVEVLTPVVAAQPDGIHVVSVDAPVYWEIGLFPAGEPRHSYWAESDMDGDEFARPVPPGQVGVACIDHEIITGAEHERLVAEASPFLLTDPDGLFTPYVPECDVSDQVLYHWDLDGVDIDDASDRLRTLPGVRPDDMIQLAGYDWEWGSARMWRIVRDGRIIAGLRVGDQGGGVASGFVCRSSGITGDEEQ
jgi:hypothetical protein